MNTLMKIGAAVALLIASGTSLAQERRPVPSYRDYIKMCMANAMDSNDQKEMVVTMAWCQCNIEKQPPVGTMVSQDEAVAMAKQCDQEFNTDPNKALDKYARKALAAMKALRQSTSP